MNILAGLDLGAVQVKLAVLNEEGQAEQPLLTMVRPNRGQPHRVAIELLEEGAKVFGEETHVRLGVTGGSASLFLTGGHKAHIQEVNPVVGTVAAVFERYSEVRTIIDLGGQYCKWILVGRDQHDGKPLIEDFAINGLCAAGSGIFLEQQAARLGLSVQELGVLAEKAGRGATIAGRCSVFAKSDMIHLQQKGTPIEEIAYGLCLALTRTFAATVLEKKTIEPPVAFIGGGATSAGLIKALHFVLELEKDDVIIPSGHLFACATGAAIAARETTSLPFGQLLTKLHSASIPMVQQNSKAQSIAPLKRRTIAPEHMTPQPAQGQNSISVHLGVDVGSVSTNVVLLTPELEYLDGVYIATGGKPVAALDQALIKLERRYGSKLKVLSVGATGSGRHLVQRLLGADLVKNEITAQLVSAAHYVPEVETVFEIGGQDAKFMTARKGLLQDFEMNKICSAGTGSFLEEQAERLGVKIVDEFSQKAFSSHTPVDLGSRCTVFMDAELCHAMASNKGVEDLCAGLAYAIARNYIEKVIAGRKIGSTIVFQGGTSANSAVVSAFEHVLGRSIVVHPHGRVSGAIGAALLSAQTVSSHPDKISLFQGFDACRDHSLSSFECGKCENRCQVNQIKVGSQTAHFGDACERFSSDDRQGQLKKTRDEDRPIPDLFRARADLLSQYLPQEPNQEESSSKPRIGLIRSSLMLESLPFWAHLLKELSFEPIVASSLRRQGEDEGSGMPPTVCLPMKLANSDIQHLLTEQQVEKILVPSILELESCHPGDRPHTCLYVQQLPDMLGQTYGNRLLIPQLTTSKSAHFRKEANLALAKTLGVSQKKVGLAWQAAMEHQAQFVKDRIQLGQEALANLSGVGVVVIGKPYNIHDPRANLGLARHLDRVGLTALPMDVLPLADEVLDDNWYMLPWQLNRHQLRALQFLSKHEGLFPIHVSSYGCGPDAFTIPHLKRYWTHRPGLFLEFDGHRGEAGLVTRLEAFADEIHNYSHAGIQPEVPRRPVARNNDDIPAGTRCLLPYTSEHVYAYAGMLKRAGFIPQILPHPDGESVRLGEEVSSGRECHPYVIIAGDMVKFVKSSQVSAGDRFFIPGTRLPCLMSQYGDGFRKILEELDENRLQVFDQHPGEAGRMFGKRGMLDLYDGLKIIDYLIVAGCRLRPYEEKKGAINRALFDCYAQVEKCLAEKTDKRFCLTSCLDKLARVPLCQREQRPVIGVTGDLYTRINAAGNNGLFARLEEMGCEVWPSPFFAASTDFELPQDASRFRKQGRFTKAFSTTGIAALLKVRSSRLAAVLDPDLRDRCVEPSQPVLQKYASAYTQANSNHLIRTMIAKMVDFSNRGSDGVISAIGLNCMAGTAAAATIAKIRQDHGGIPIISLTSGGATLGPSQEILLDTFIHQVRGEYQRKR